MSELVDTAFTRLVGCRLPIQQAGMGGSATPDLVVAVAESGALGMLAMTATDELAGVLDAIRERTTEPFGVNFLVPFLDPGAVAIAADGARVVEFFYGAPDRTLVERVHGGGALCSWQVGSVDEARAAADAGCDVVVAQGTEAGGHVRGTTGLLPLLAQVLDVVDVPVLAAGGIGSARAVKQVIDAGAAGARVGTRFLAASEADVHPDYVDALLGAQADDTVLTDAFSVGWPDAPHRVLGDCITAATRATADHVGEVRLGEGVVFPVPRLSPLPPTRATSGDIRAMALYAGTSVGHVRARTSAAAIVRELVSELNPTSSA